MLMVLWPRSFHNLKVLILIKDYPFVAQMELIKIVLVVVTIQDLHVHQMPIKIVYLNGNDLTLLKYYTIIPQLNFEVVDVGEN